LHCRTREERRDGIMGGLWGDVKRLKHPLLVKDAALRCLLIAKDSGPLLDKGHHALFLVFGCEG
jgi:hypothetical protein